MLSSPAGPDHGLVLVLGQQHDEALLIRDASQGLGLEQRQHEAKDGLGLEVFLCDGVAQDEGVVFLILADGNSSLEELIKEPIR